MANDRNFQALLRDNEPNDVPTDKRPPTADRREGPSPEKESQWDEEKEIKYVAKKIKLTLMSSWGQRNLIGLTGRTWKKKMLILQTRWYEDVLHLRTINQMKGSAT